MSWTYQTKNALDTPDQGKGITPNLFSIKRTTLITGWVAQYHPYLWSIWYQGMRLSVCMCVCVCQNKQKNKNKNKKTKNLQLSLGPNSEQSMLLMWPNDRPSAVLWFAHLGLVLPFYLHSQTQLHSSALPFMIYSGLTHSGGFFPKAVRIY